MDDIPAPPWLHLLKPLQRSWREMQFARGRNPDSLMERDLIAAGVWPEKNAKA